MLTKPRFSPHFHVEVVEPKTVYLLSEQRHFALTGLLYVLLAPLLNGQYTVEEIVQQLQDRVPVSTIYHGLSRLESKGYLIEADDTIPEAIAAFWSSQGLDPNQVRDRLSESQVEMQTVGQVQSELLVSALRSLNIPVRDQGDLKIVLTDDYLQLDLQKLNQSALNSGQPWMLVKPVGTVIWLGPIFIPGKTGCWSCLAQRLQDNREVETAVAQQTGRSSPLVTSRAVLPTHLQVGLNLAATEIAQWLVRGDNKKILGKLMTWDLTSMEVQHHVLVQRPQCSACGSYHSYEHFKPRPITLNSHYKISTVDGGHRSFAPEQTFRNYQHHISPITGVVSSLTKVDTANELVHVYSANHKSRGKLDSLTELRHSLRRKSAGKGKTDLQSKVSGLCEAIERYSGIFTGEEYRIKGTYSHLESAAIHPNSWMQFSEQQYQNRHQWNPQHSRFARIPEPFDAGTEIDWTPVWSLTNQEFKYLPTACCYFNYPLTKEHQFCHDDSNGSAAGNTIEEGILQGFMELVERDSVALWWYNRVPRPGVDLDSFNEPYLQAIQDNYRDRQRELWVLDLTSDFKIPSFAAISRRTDQPQEEIIMGFGTHFEPKIAILRAVTELNQTSQIELTDSKAHLQDPDLVNWLESATLENQPYLQPLTNTTKAYSNYPQNWSHDLREDVLKCVELAKEQGLETLVLNQTRPDIGLPVVKVFVPGMRHFWNRFAPGRLYDVPVKLGWLSQPLAEQELNPIPMFL